MDLVTSPVPDQVADKAPHRLFPAASPADRHAAPDDDRHRAPSAGRCLREFDIIVEPQNAREDSQNAAMPITDIKPATAYDMQQTADS